MDAPRRPLAERVTRRACRLLFHDSNHDLAHSLMIAGTGRSGTTWLAETLGPSLPSRIVFEPFNGQQIEAFAKYANYRYIRPDEEDAEFEALCRQVLTGQFRHPWIERQAYTLFPTYRIVKAIRANLLLAWLKNRFPEVPMILVVRHPCAVVASQLRLGWDADRDLDSILSQPKLVEDFLKDKRDLIRFCVTPEERHALIWSINNLVPIAHLDRGALPIFVYENLVRDPGKELPGVYRSLGLSYDPKALERVAQPSSTTSQNSAVMARRDPVSEWKRLLSRSQVHRILRIVDAFGLRALYDATGSQLTAATNRGQVDRRNTERPDSSDRRRRAANVASR